MTTKKELMHRTSTNLKRIIFHQQYLTAKGGHPCNLNKGETNKKYGSSLRHSAQTITTIQIASWDALIIIQIRSICHNKPLREDIISTLLASEINGATAISNTQGISISRRT
ncbi:Nitrogen regulatory protein PII/ATP phosphoribosyltransferase C-terminal protein [Dioscorea alata]|uniref:Nitrogen regulatory protein PII/ATP phosphoribosyltransferase C-terminal protein n=1 Tax=Dioscorea alata TaxID=55571 RepID=A0ACB7WFT9_DIOAL|nr:Nitrogen regulatory protein PII/ATP phosphoribosyltransferase C-terminal protein [Dioscorea alata]